MDIDVQAEDQAGANSVGPNPVHFVQREENVFVPLVALDQLPAWINVGGIPRVFSEAELSDCHGTVVGFQRLQGEYDVRVGHDINGHQTSPEAETARHAPSPNSPLHARDALPTTRQDAGDQRYQPVTPGFLGGKKYCTHWIRTGECDFMQQGCMFLHRIPDQETLERLGFKSYPRWFREMPGAYQAANSENLDSMCPRAPFQRTRNIRGAANLSSSGLPSASHGYASNKIRHSWPYPNPRADNHRRDRNHHASSQDSHVPGDESREYYDSQRSLRFRDARDSFDSPRNTIQDVRNTDKHIGSQPQAATRGYEAGNSQQEASNGYVATPRAYDDSDHDAFTNNRPEGDHGDQRLNDSADQYHSTSRPAEPESHESSNMVPQNFYVEPSTERRSSRADNRTHGGQRKDARRSHRNDHASSSPTYDKAVPGSRQYNTSRNHRPRSDRRNGNDNSGRPMKRQATRRYPSDHNERVRDMPRLQYPPRSRDEHREDADFYVRTDSRSPPRNRSYSNGRSDEAHMEDLITFD